MTWSRLLLSQFAVAIRMQTLYWMARMLKGGEDPVFIARRMLIAASEDIGNSNPNALLACGRMFPFGSSCRYAGMPYYFGTVCSIFGDQCQK